MWYVAWLVVVVVVGGGGGGGVVADRVVYTCRCCCSIDALAFCSGCLTRNRFALPQQLLPTATSTQQQR